MAPAAAPGDTAVLDNLKPPPGIIIPPPGEIREAIEKTAGYVIRGGPGLEQRIRDNHGTNPRFSFLMTHTDPFNAYYEWRKQEIRSGRGTAVAAGRAGNGSAALAQAEPKGPLKPPDFQFSARMPRMHQKDLEIVRLTALFVAKNGRHFMTQLAQREAGNPQFQFLIQNHTYHNFFQKMVDQYSILLREGGVNSEGTNAQQERLAELKQNIKDKFHALGRAKLRAEYAKFQDAERQKQEDEEIMKKTEFARIDWNDFIVVETIVFTESDDQITLPPPTTLNDIQYASLEDKNKFSANSNHRIEEAFPFDDTSYNAYPPQTYAPQTHTPQTHPLQTHSPQTYPTQTYSPQTYGTTPQFQTYPQPTAPIRTQSTEEEEEEAQRIQEREEALARVQHAQAEAQRSVASMKIRENYVPKAAARAANNFGVQTALCPNCKQQIAMDELDAHMRIELLDPRWKEQKAKAESRYAATSFSTADVASNLKRLASQRSDVFDGVTGQPVSEEELARRKRVALNSFDGNPDGKSQAHILHLQSLNVEEQIRAIHQRFAPR